MEKFEKVASRRVVMTSKGRTSDRLRPPYGYSIPDFSLLTMWSLVDCVASVGFHQRSLASVLSDAQCIAGLLLMVASIERQCSKEKRS